LATIQIGGRRRPRTHPNTTIYLDKSSAALLSAAVPIVVQR
jgi:hypothetical protein